MDRVLNVLVVDDSVLIQQVLSEVLSSDPSINVVGVASDPYEARVLIKELKPDVITLDIEMPRMDGITFLRNLMKLHPLPVVMLSTLTAQGADETLTALELGAVDFIQKPKLGASSMTASSFAQELIEKVKIAGGIKNRIMARLPQRIPASVDTLQKLNLGANRNCLITIGSSTGGTEALQEVLSVLPVDIPPIVIAQHIPAAFSLRFAKRLNEKCQITVVEAEHGQALNPGTAYIAPGGFHLRVERHGAILRCRIDDSEPVNRHKPSVEALFDSVTSAGIKSVIGVMLTGMGNDGAEAMLRLRQSGAHTIAQDEASSMIWGMPGSAVKLGAADEVLPLNKIPAALVQRLLSSQS